MLSCSSGGLLLLNSCLGGNSGPATWPPLVTKGAWQHKQSLQSLYVEWKLANWKYRSYRCNIQICTLCICFHLFLPALWLKRNEMTFVVTRGCIPLAFSFYAIMWLIFLVIIRWVGKKNGPDINAHSLGWIVITSPDLSSSTIHHPILNFAQ